MKFLFENKESIGVLVALLTFAVGVGTFMKSISEYSGKNTLERFEKYIALSKRWDEDEDVQKIIFLLEGDNAELADIPYKCRHDFLAFYEEISLMFESELLKPAVAYCMFGYYAVRCLRSANFWRNINKDAPAWYLFVRFAQKMEEIDKKVSADRTIMQRWSFRF